MRNKIYNRSVTIRDNNMTRWTINFEICETEPSKRINAKTLEEFDEHFIVSICGEGGRSCGQCYDSIIPRTPGQEDLLLFWKRYHLGGMKAGTKIQEEYLKSKQYQEDYKKFLELFSGYNEEYRNNFDRTTFEIMCSAYKVFPEHNSILKDVLAKYMQNNPVKYILGIKPYCQSHNTNDYAVKCLFLAMCGLYIDGGYKYGVDWLYLPIPEEICEKTDKLCEILQNEEKQLSESLTMPGDFDMGAEDFKATEDVVEKVMNMRECGEREAKDFIALGCFLGVTFGDLNATFTESGNCLYIANGEEYYVGTEDELTQIAQDIVYSEDYEYIWREAVAAKKTTLGFEAWADSIIDIDGWCSVLNHWDGRYEEYKIVEKWICVSKT